MKLQKGDVIYLEKGQNVYGKIAEKFAYYNCILSDKITSTKITIGDILSNKIEDKDFKKELNYLINSIIGDFKSRFGCIVNKDKVEQFIIENIDYKIEQFDTSIYIGEYVVYNISYEGNDYDYRVECRKLNDEKWDKNGLEIYFYQNGGHSVEIKDINPIRKMEMVFC